VTKQLHIPREKLLLSIADKSRELSTRTVLFHHWISERLGLNTIDHKCLDLIVRSESPITGVQLVRLTGLSSGAVTGVIDRLENAGYVTRERDNNDRRLVFIKPVMNKIEKEIVPLFNTIQKIMTRAYSDYTDKELSIILDFTNKCILVMAEQTNNLMKHKSVSQKSK
jgi:DNA-binding MarR family transcriptional regulator